MESCLLYTCARAPKAHKQSNDGERKKRIQEEMREISLVLSASTIMMIASSSHTHTWHRFSLSLRLNPLHRAIIRSHHHSCRLNVHIYIYNQE
jgi:hypothetical protein